MAENACHCVAAIPHILFLSNNCTLDSVKCEQITSKFPGNAEGNSIAVCSAALPEMKKTFVRLILLAPESFVPRGSQHYVLKQISGVITFNRRWKIPHCFRMLLIPGIDAC